MGALRSPGDIFDNHLRFGLQFTPFKLSSESKSGSDDEEPPRRAARRRRGNGAGDTILSRPMRGDRPRGTGTAPTGGKADRLGG